MSDVTVNILRWIILLPLIGAFVNGCVLRPISPLVSGLIGTAASAGAFVISCYMFLRFSHVQALDPWFTWFEAGRIKVNFHLEAVGLVYIMLLVVTGVGSLIHLYSIGYMHHEKTPWRFFAYLNLFLAAMLVLVLSSDLVGVFMGWEGVGLCSYLLIGYWHDKDANAAAGMKAFLTNRVGDLGFLVAIFVLQTYAHTTRISDLIALVSGHGELSISLSEVMTSPVPAWVWTVAAAGLFWASTGKSAQIPLYIWLPDAMAGPTPVSALIHAATMVTSGIFLSARVWPLFAGQHEVLRVMLWGGIATAWLSALIAVKQRDIKKVLAYSTVSQLGFMFVALGCGAPQAAFFHVVTHACFKALLFLGSGSVIHGMHEKQDIYEMGGLRHHMPQTHLTFLIGTLAIIGFPLTSGFFSKDLILAKAFETGPIFFVLMLGAALMTALYMLRMYTLTFWGEARTKEAEHAHESSAVMTYPLAVLAGLSVMVGWIQTPAVLGNFNSIGRALQRGWDGWEAAEHGAEMSHLAEWGMIFMVSALSLSVAWYSYKKFLSWDPATARDENLFAKLAANKFYVDELYELILIRPLRRASQVCSWFFDTLLINGGLHRVRDGYRMAGQVLSVFHTGNVQTYAWYVAVAAALAIAIARVMVRL